MTTVLVLREGVHGMPIEEYAAALRERLPDHEVRLARTRAQERDLVADAEVVTSVQIDEDLLSRADALELFACAYAGYGHLPTDALAERDVAVTTASGRSMSTPSACATAPRRAGRPTRSSGRTRSTTCSRGPTTWCWRAR